MSGGRWSDGGKVSLSDGSVTGPNAWIWSFYSLSRGQIQGDTYLTLTLLKEILTRGGRYGQTIRWNYWHC
jgi:hypothetical protein